MSHTISELIALWQRDLVRDTSQVAVEDITAKPEVKWFVQCYLSVCFCFHTQNVKYDQIITKMLCTSAMEECRKCFIVDQNESLRRQ